MKQYESERDLEAEITANIENIQNFYGLTSVNSLKKLVEIILDPKKSEQLFKQRSVTVSSLFKEGKQLAEINPEHISLFAQKYTYQKLVQKYPKPKGQTNKVLTCILQKKMAKEIMNSHQTRKNIWLLVSGARFNMNHHKGLYNQLLQYDSYPDYFMRAIKQDINRTVSKSLTSEEELKSLSNILIAFSRRNPYVGYCQGLNFVAYFLLTMQFTQEEAFWLLSQIIQTVIPMDYYTNMIGVVCDQQVFLSVLAKTNPLIVQKFDEVGLDPSVLSIQWFVCLFTSSLPFYLVKIVWDRLLVQGPRAFIKAGIVILAHFQKQILYVQQFHQIILLLQRGTKQLTLPQAEFNQRFQKIYISREGLVLARTLYREYHIKEKLSDKITAKKSSSQPLECDPKWPICVVALQKNKRDRQEMDVWIFRESRPPRIDHQYLLKQQNKAGTKVKVKGQQTFKKKTIKPVFISPNYQDFMSLKPIPQETQSQIIVDRESPSIFNDIWSKNPSELSQTYSNTNKLEKNDGDQNYKGLIIGRMEHICKGQTKSHHEHKKQYKAKKSMLIEEQIQNQELKKENMQKYINVPDSDPYSDQSPGDQEQMLRRSQTIKFFSKFVSENFQLSQIIAPGTKQF